jgi:ATP-dependent Clp protease protease subunit
MINTVNIDKLIKLRKLDDLIDSPIVVYVNKFDEDSAKKFSDDMRNAHNTKQSIIPIVIDSYGGYIYSLLSMITTIENSQIPVVTICQGKAMSCGSVLFSCGTKRYMDNNATLMIHDASGMSWGKTEEVKANAKEQDRLSKFIFRKMAANCGHSNLDYFLDKLHEKSHVEWYLTAKEAKACKLVTDIKIPKFTTDIKVSTVFG